MAAAGVVLYIDAVSDGWQRDRTGRAYFARVLSDGLFRK
jgi:hypothetical protein